MEVTVGGIISGKRVKITKNNETMGFFKLEDFYGTIDAIVFPKSYLRIQNKIIEDVPVLIRGRLSLREDEEPKIICNSIEEFELPIEKMYLKITKDKEENVDSLVLPLLKKNFGETSVFLYYEEIKVTKVVPKEMSVKVTDKLIKDLEGILGEGSVKCV